MNKYRMAMLLFIGSEAVFFLLLMIAYVNYHAAMNGGPNAANSLHPLKTGVYTVLLLFSSVTVWRAESAWKRERAGGAIWLGATIVLGAVFLVGQGIEYADLLQKNVTISRDLFGTTFFTLTGFHGLHVFIGLLMLGTLLATKTLGKSSMPTFDAMEAVSIYWHFVDVVWIFVFSIVYLWALV